MSDQDQQIPAATPEAPIQVDPVNAPIPAEPGAELPSWVAPAIGLTIVGLILIFGGLYLWGSLLTPEDLAPLEAPARVNNEPETPRAQADVQVTETMSPSTEIDAIDADLESTQLDSIDADLQAMDAELSEFENQLNTP